MKKNIIVFFALFSYSLTTFAATKPSHKHDFSTKTGSEMNCRYVPKTTGHQLRWNCRCDGDIKPYHLWSKLCGVPKYN